VDQADRELMTWVEDGDEPLMREEENAPFPRRRRRRRGGGGIWENPPLLPLRIRCLRGRGWSRSSVDLASLVTIWGILGLFEFQSSRRRMGVRWLLF
jgi:hypothetical protein